MQNYDSSSRLCSTNTSNENVIYLNYSLCLPSILGIARCFTFGGSKKRALHDPAILPRSDLSKEKYMNKEEQTTINHFHEKLLKLKDMMKTKVHLYYNFIDLIKF